MPNLEFHSVCGTLVLLPEALRCRRAQIGHLGGYLLPHPRASQMIIPDRPETLKKHDQIGVAIARISFSMRLCNQSRSSCNRARDRERAVPCCCCSRARTMSSRAVRNSESCIDRVDDLDGEGGNRRGGGGGGRGGSLRLGGSSRSRDEDLETVEEKCDVDRVPLPMAPGRADER